MSAKIIDISGKMIDEETKRDLAILCRDIEVANSRSGHWADVEEKLTLMLGEAMIVSDLTSFETETMVVTLEGDEIVIEGRSIQ